MFSPENELSCLRVQVADKLVMLQNKARIENKEVVGIIFETLENEKND